MGHLTTHHQPGDQTCPLSGQLYPRIILHLGLLKSVLRARTTCSLAYFTLGNCRSIFLRVSFAAEEINLKCSSLRRPETDLILGNILEHQLAYSHVSHRDTKHLKLSDYRECWREIV